MPALQSEFEFQLPRGYLDRAGTLHRVGIMRLATARDELLPLLDDRVKANSDYLTVVLLAGVITSLGSLQDVRWERRSSRVSTPRISPSCRICTGGSTR